MRWRTDLDGSVIDCLWLSGLICVLIILTVLASICIRICVGVGVGVLIILILVLILILIIVVVGLRIVCVCWIGRSSRLGVSVRIRICGILLSISWIDSSARIISSSVRQNLRVKIESHTNDC